MPKLLDFVNHKNLIVTIDCRPKHFPMLINTNAEIKNFCKFFVEFNEKIPNFESKNRFDDPCFEIDPIKMKFLEEVTKVSVLIHSP